MESNDITMAMAYIFTYRQVSKHDFQDRHANNLETKIRGLHVYSKCAEELLSTSPQLIRQILAALIGRTNTDEILWISSIHESTQNR